MKSHCEDLCLIWCPSHHMVPFCLCQDLAEDLKKELGGDLETIMMALTYSYFEYLARELQSAFKGMSTKEKVVLDIILTRNNAEMHLLQDTFAKSKSRVARESPSRSLPLPPPPPGLL